MSVKNILILGSLLLSQTAFAINKSEIAPLCDLHDSSLSAVLVQVSNSAGAHPQLPQELIDAAQNLFNDRSPGGFHEQWLRILKEDGTPEGAAEAAKFILNIRAVCSQE